MTAVDLLWHMVLSGFVFGALLVAVFGTALPAPAGLDLLGPRGAFLAVFAAALEGSTLGGVCGLLLFVTTRAFYFPMSGNVHGYLATAGATCALASLTISLVDWLLHGCPDPNGLALWRTLDMGLSGAPAASWYTREARRPVSCTRF